jgi:ribosomal protein S18 acetylase RimI-like enzyme/signal peptidase I
MRPEEFKPSERISSELTLSSPALVELIQAVLSKDHSFRFQAKGFSMFPFIREGDVIRIAPLKPSSPRLGDVVAFTPPGTQKLLVHRVIGGKGDSCLIRGDNAPAADGFLPRGRIIGRVILVERNGKRVYCGTGPERFLIALLIRTNLLSLLVQCLGSLLRPFKSFFFSPRRKFRGFYLYRKFARLFRKGIEIQEADAEDLQKVREWFHQLDKDPSDFRGAHVTTFIAQKKEKILGHAKLIRNLEERHPLHGYWLSSLAVGEPFQGMGIGEDLTRKVMAKAEEEGAKELLLIVYEDQKAAIHLYRKLGFQIKRDSALEDELEQEQAYLGSKKVVMSKPVCI